MTNELDLNYSPFQKPEILENHFGLNIFSLLYFVLRIVHWTNKIGEQYWSLELNISSKKEIKLKICMEYFVTVSDVLKTRVGQVLSRRSGERERAVRSEEWSGLTLVNINLHFTKELQVRNEPHLSVQTTTKTSLLHTYKTRGKGFNSIARIPAKKVNKDFVLSWGFGFLQRKYDWILWSRR